MKSNIKKVHHCKICNKTFTSSYKLKSHLYFHKAIASRYKCNFCLKEYYRKDEFKRHVDRHNNQQRYHYCDHCGRGFVDKRNLINHLYIHDDLFVPSKRYNCVACDVSYCEERLLQYHIRKHHMNLDCNTPTHIKKKLNESWIEPALDSTSCVQITKVKTNVLSIRKCKAKAKSDNKPAFYVKVEVKPEKLERQSYLASAFASKDNLYSKAICDYCDKEMLKKSLITHIRERHTALRRFNCFECNRSFNRPYLLTDHNCGKVRKTKNNQIVTEK